MQAADRCIVQLAHDWFQPERPRSTFGLSPTIRSVATGKPVERTSEIAYPLIALVSRSNWWNRRTGCFISWFTVVLFASWTSGSESVKRACRCVGYALCIYICVYACVCRLMFADPSCAECLLWMLHQLHEENKAIFTLTLSSGVN